MNEKIEKVRMIIGDRVLTTVSIEKLEGGLREKKLLEKNVWLAIAEGVEDVRYHNGDVNKVKVCDICEQYKSKAIYDVGSEGVCLLTGIWMSFAQTCEKWEWDEIRIRK